jgi:hypothetical protein
VYHASCSNVATTPIDVFIKPLATVQSLYSVCLVLPGTASVLSGAPEPQYLRHAEHISAYQKWIGAKSMICCPGGDGEGYRKSGASIFLKMLAKPFLKNLCSASILKGVLAMDDTVTTGQAKGGYARAAKLSPEERSEIGAKAAKKRWEEKEKAGDTIPHVLESFKSVLDISGTKLPCAIVMGPNGIQRVLSENGITNAILGNRSGASKRLKKKAQEEGTLLPLFVAPGQLKPFITNELLDGPLQMIDYLDGNTMVRGYDAGVLAAVCNVWLKAREAGALLPQQLPKAQKAEILARALAETGIIALVDEATGYERVRPQGALQAYLELVIRRELAAWGKKFPDEFYENIYHLKGWVWPGMSKNRYSIVAHYTIDLVYARLGPGILDELIKKSPKNENGNLGV